ncbi:MAG TPA: HD domain-containing protein [Candidatus Saccharimonadales bacterium]|nr:HD domain-containing protein [Candidatus Saccharimonadales bacterium]
MSKLEQVQDKVRKLYLSKNSNRDEWSDWLYDNHVLVVAKNAHELAKKYGANEELSEVAALLHDIADVEMARSDSAHEERSLAIAKEVMAEADYTDDEIALVVDDAIRYHSCHGDERPKSKEGLILATADSLAHLQTDFYIYATWAFGKTRSLEELKEWSLKKIERDLNNKISFEDEREAARADYEMIKELFSR